MAERTCYEIPGVDKTADADTIKKAYHKLVRKYHPDVSKESGVAKRTAEINTAYETLSDREKRAECDELLTNLYGRDVGGNPFGGAQSGGLRYEYRGGEPFGAGDFNFEDLFAGFSRSQRRTHAGPNGSIKGEDQHTELSIDIYAVYIGAERSLNLNVPTVDGYGRVGYQTRTPNVKIPKGITEGQQIRLAGQGLPGYNGDANGDLYLKIKLHDKPDLYVENKRDVYQAIDVKPWEAVLGGRIIVPTAAGRLQVNLPVNSQNGKSIRLKGKGIPAKEAGDLYLNIRISVPKAESEADRAAWAQLVAHFDGKSASN